MSMVCISDDERDTSRPPLSEKQSLRKDDHQATALRSNTPMRAGFSAFILYLRSLFSFFAGVALSPYAVRHVRRVAHWNAGAHDPSVNAFGLRHQKLAYRLVANAAMPCLLQMISEQCLGAWPWLVVKQHFN